MIKISILNNADKYAYMEYQSGNDQKEFNDTYGCGGFYDLQDLFEALEKTYGGEEFILKFNLKEEI